MTSLSPNAGPLSGGTSVTIAGSWLGHATSVLFGTAPAASYRVVSSSTISATSPPGSDGTVDVTVTTAVGTSATGATDKFTYLPQPELSGLSPVSGAVTGGNVVTLTGSGFTDASQVYFGSATPSDFTVQSDTEITAFAPQGPAGAVPVSVVTPAGTTQGQGDLTSYTYNAGTNPGFTVSGNKVMSPSGHVFVPYGSVVSCLGYIPVNGPLAKQNCGKNSSNATNVANIEALGTVWHADDVRIQVAQEDLFDQSPYDSAYLAMLDGEVQLANSLGMVATISLQEELVPHGQGPVFPDSTSVTFWNFMAVHYENDPMVMYDMFNEPHLSQYALSPGQTEWGIWRNGGAVDDLSKTECTKSGPSNQCVDDTFVGMQQLLTDIRNTGANNIVIAEGPNDDQNLSGIPASALTGSNLVYGIEPNIFTAVTRAQWKADYGNLAATYPIFGESLVAFQGSSLCNANAVTLLPQEFQYMQSIGMGSLVWGLVPGDLITTSPDVPTNYDGESITTCTSPDPGTLPGPPAPTNTVGPGADALAFFESEASGVPLANPVISGVSAMANQQVTITGTGLADTTDVTFGGINAPSFVAVSNGEVVANVPSSGVGTSVDVITTAGSSTASLPPAPQNVTGQTGLNQATVSFTPEDGGTATSYMVTAADQTNATNGGQTARGTASPIVIAGLTTGDTYTFTVSAITGNFVGPASSPSGDVVSL